MRKTFQIAALLVVALLSACSGGEEKKEGTPLSFINRARAM